MSTHGSEVVFRALYGPALFGQAHRAAVVAHLPAAADVRALRGKKRKIRHTHNLTQKIKKLVTRYES